MNKENILFGIVGLLAGVIIGFVFANSVNQQGLVSTAAPSTATAANSALPPGHPDVPGGQNQQPTAAVPEVQAAIEKARREPDNFDAQMKAAELYNQIQRFDGAVEFLTRANQLKPNDYDVIVQLGNSNFDADKYTEAEKWYTRALTMKSDDINVRTDLGLTFIFRDPPNYDRAIQEFNRSLQIDPGHIQTLQNLTVAYTKKGDVEKAKSTLAKLEQLDPSNAAVSKLRDDINKL
jgi:tetratricopeptide (TPR) repeat protein